MAITEVSSSTWSVCSAEIEKSAALCYNGLVGFVRS
nr:MAG TPA: hypothetical protein [Caudoviricetes sp.]